MHFQNKFMIWLHLNNKIMQLLNPPINISNELLSAGDQWLRAVDRLRYLWVKLRNIDLWINGVLTIKRFRKSWLKHITRVWGALVLQKLDWKRSSPIFFRLFEIPTELLQNQQTPYLIEYLFISLLDLVPVLSVFFWAFKLFDPDVVATI